MWGGMSRAERDPQMSDPERPVFKLEPFKLGQAWSLNALWPDGLLERIGGFTRREDAADWIERHSSDWIACAKTNRPRRPRHSR